jgi:hypothetical protein
MSKLRVNQAPEHNQDQSSSGILYGTRLEHRQQSVKALEFMCSRVRGSERRFGPERIPLAADCAYGVNNAKYRKDRPIMSEGRLISEGNIFF